MRILLIEPPFKTFTGYTNNFFPIGLATLAGIMEKEGHTAMVLEIDNLDKKLDVNFSDEYRRLRLYVDGINDDKHPVWTNIKKCLDSFKPDLIGITIMTQKFGSALKAAKVCKEWNKNVPIVAGGPHPTLDSVQTLEGGNIDFVVREEGERVLPELVKALEGKKDLKSVNSLSYIKDGVITHNIDGALIENLDTVPFPARELLMNLENYSSEDLGVIMTTRGCPYRCTYCFHMLSKRLRSRSVDNVLEEIRLVKEKYGTKQFAFKDDTFTINRKRLAELLDKMIAQKLNINWECTTRVNVLDEEMLKHMLKAGCNVIKIGVETGSQKILDDTKKGITLEQIRKTAKLLNKYNVFWSAYFMMGLPQETEDDILGTYHFMKELNPHYAGLGVYNPMPKTELFDTGVKMGLLCEKVPIEHFFTVNPKDFYFKDPKKRVQLIETERFEQLSNFMMDAFHKHNTRSINLLRRGWARRRAYRSDPGLLVKDVTKAVKWVVSA